MTESCLNPSRSSTLPLYIKDYLVLLNRQVAGGSTANNALLRDELIFNNLTAVSIPRNLYKSGV